MFLSDLELLRHINDEINFVLTAVDGKDKDAVIYDQVLCRALVRSMEIIGEASKKVSPAFKSAHPSIEWKKMAGTRDRLIHDYFGVDYDIVWDIIINKLPPLQKYIGPIIERASESNKDE